MPLFDKEGLGEIYENTKSPLAPLFQRGDFFTIEFAMNLTAMV